MNGLLQGVNGRLRASPVLLACGSAGVKNGVCDVVVQVGVEGKAELDWRRTLTFLMFGVSWVGGGQYVLFTKVYPRLFPGLPGAWSVVGVTFVDNFLHIPLLYLPLFYATREFATTSKLDLSTAARKWRRNLTEDVTLQAGIFVPAQAFNFFVNPPHLRVPFIVGVGVLWIGVLSYVRGDNNDDS
mmetsp:Transcript_22618/g.72791  ORF Transcript_22618/g.72791 Transcript_22618/m.72791 type:complete len:185 (-) Transcript_22618:148-702(-)